MENGQGDSWESDAAPEVDAEAEALVERALELEHEGAIDDAFALLDQALGILERDSAPPTPLAASVRLRMGGLAHAAGELDASASWIEGAIHLLREVYRPVHEEVATAMVGLGQVLSELNDLEYAEITFAAALEDWTELRGAGSPEALDTLGRLASVVEARGDVGRAEGLVFESIEIRSSLPESDDPGRIGAWIHLAQMRLERRALSSADEALAEALQLATNSGDTGALATIHGVYGQVQQAAGRPELAEDSLRRSVQCFEELGESEPELPVALGNLAHFLQEKGDLDEAESVLVRAVSLLGQQEGSEPQLHVWLRELGHLSRQRRQLDAAEAYLRDAHALAEQLYGESDPVVASSFADLGRIAREQGKLDEAWNYFDRCLQVRQHAAEPQPTEIATALNNVGLVEKELGNLDSAEARFGEAIEALQQRHGPDHPALAITMTNLAQVLEVRGDASGAAGLLSEALRVLESRAPTDPGTAVVRRKHERLQLKLKEFR